DQPLRRFPPGEQRHDERVLSQQTELRDQLILFDACLRFCWLSLRNRSLFIYFAQWSGSRVKSRPQLRAFLFPWGACSHARPAVLEGSLMRYFEFRSRGGSLPGSIL
ncbi:unnamed protein product, partial [Ectocarpus sp. 12 AP-2014]